MTISDGFSFAIGRALGELAMAGMVLGALFVGFILVVAVLSIPRRR